jgi:4-aminobutyrate aminotransferase-like enzyme
VERLEALQRKHPQRITAVRGKGLLIGIDVTAPVGDVVAACRDRGLLILTAGDNTARLAPPLILEDTDADRGAEIFERVVSGG